MGRRRNGAEPEMRFHAHSGQARVRINGKVIYLGPWDSPEAKSAYHRIVAEWHATAMISCFGSSDGVTFAAVYGCDGQAATINVGASGGAAPLPDAIYPLRFVRLVAGTDLGTSATVTVSLKS